MRLREILRVRLGNILRRKIMRRIQRRIAKIKTRRRHRGGHWLQWTITLVVLRAVAVLHVVSDPGLQYLAHYISLKAGSKRYFK